MPVDVDAEVLANTRLSDDYNVIAFAAPEIARRTQPGQFMMVKPAHGLEPLLRRPFSVFEILRDAAGEPVGVTLLNKRIGVGTGLLYDLRAGDRVPVLGPLGRPFTPVPDDERAEAWLVAGGVGLAPFATMAEALLARNVRTTLFYGARRASDLYYADWFRTRGVTVITATEDGSDGDRGFITVPLARAFAERPADRPLSIYSCGPTPMMRAVSDLAARHGHDVEVSLEQTMGCGLGGCYSCVVRIRENGHTPHFVRSCTAGPVFRGRDIVWEELH
jgi:dihydroorotate dehydrogenase electron transfer subunit